MIPTKFEASFLQAIVLLTAFKGTNMDRAQAFLLMLGLKGQDFTCADIPGEITNGSRHIAGAACGALIAQGLIDVVGRVKSPLQNAKGRKLDVLRIPSNKATTARTWLREHGYKPEDAQLPLALTT